MPVYRISWSSNGDFLADMEAANETEARYGIYKVLGIYQYPVDAAALLVHPENLSVHISSLAPSVDGQPPDPEQAFLNLDCVSLESLQGTTPA